MSQKAIDCVYEVPVRQSKEHMRTEIEQLREQQQRNERILAALVSNEQADEVLHQLRSGESIEAVSDLLNMNDGKARSPGSGDGRTSYSKPGNFHAISGALRRARSPVISPTSGLAFGDTYTDSAPGSWQQWGGGEGSTSSQVQHQLQADTMTWSPEVSPPSSTYPLVGIWHHQQDDHSTPDSTTQTMRDAGMETILGEEFGWDYNRPTEPWTEITSDQALIDHLLALYFCWEYPTFASLSKEHFLEDYRLGSSRHCSPLLVNSLLAVGCRFSTQVRARTSSDDSNTAGDHFFAEAARLLALEDDRHKLTTVQALGLMSIREASCGRSSEGLYYSGQSIRLAIEMGLHNESQSGDGERATSEQAVRSATFWGSFALDQCVTSHLLTPTHIVCTLTRTIDAGLYA